MANRIIDEMPTIRQVEDADSYQIVRWHHFLRPTMSNEELPIVKMIARRYDAMPEGQRAQLVHNARKEHTL